MPRPLINSFNAGEMSFATDARVDIDKYRNGCRILENAIPKIQGGAYGRPGMEYIGAARYTDKKTRLIPFAFDVTTSFVLEFGDGYVRFWSNGTQVLSGGNPLTLATPYTETEIFNIQYTQVNDVVYLVDGAHPPQKLTRIADDNWTIADVGWVWPAMQDENAGQTNLGTQTITDLLRLNTEEWPQRVGAINGIMTFSGLTDLTGTTKTAKLDKWTGSAWTNIVTRTWTTTPPSDYTYTCTTFPAGLHYDTFRVTYSGPVHGAGAKITLTTDGDYYPVAHPSGPTTYEWGHRYRVDVPIDIAQPQPSLAECTVSTGWTWRVRVKSLATIPTNNSCKVQSWNGAAWVDVATVSLTANKWTTYNGTAPGSDTLYRLKWAGTTATNGFAMQTVPTSSAPWPTGYLADPVTGVPIAPGAGSDFGTPEHGVMILERVVASGTSDITLTLSATTGNLVEMTASAALFDPAHVGSYWQIGHRRDNAYVDIAPTTADATSSELRVLGRYDVFTYGTWKGTLNLQVQRAGTWETIRSWNSGGTGSGSDRNVIAAGTADVEQNMRLFYDHTSGTNTNARMVLEPADSRIYGLVKVTNYTSSTVLVVSVLKDVYATTATRAWSEGSWSSYRGFPRAITMDNQRIVYGGTEHEPLTIWGSVIGDFENFQRSTLEDSSYAFRIASAKGNSIVWMSNQTRFIVGTQGDEWLVEPGSNADSGGVITPSNVKITMQSSFGSAYIQPAAANDTIMFVERGRKRLREFVFQFDKQSFGAPDLTLLADHIFANTGIKQMVFASVPDPVLWVVSEDNRLMSMTFERDQSVVGWSRHITAGDVESVCVIYGDDSDEVWLLTKRSVNGADVKYLERFDPHAEAKLESDDVPMMIYLDCAKLIAQTSSTTVTGLDHLEGETVSGLADGIPFSGKVVTSGDIELDVAAETVVAGLPYTVRIQPNKLELGMQDGTSQGRRFHATQAMLRFARTGGAQYADSASGPFYDVLFRDPLRDATEFEPSFTGDKRVYLASRHRDSLALTIRNTKPLPFGLLAIAPIVEASGQ